MKNFKNFEIENQEMIFGGKLIGSYYTTSSGVISGDMYDTEKQTIVYF